MRLVRIPVISILHGHIIDYPTPTTINYLWGFGSLAGFCLVFQIVTGILLAMHYTPHVLLAFDSVEHISRDVKNGWMIRYMHANGASIFFMMVYVHIGRGLYFKSYRNIPLWYSGVLIFFLMLGIAFMGYVLPWGQMSFWGATVITNLASAIPGVGENIAKWLWGGFSIDNATLNRLFSLHYLLPFLLAGVSLLHLVFLHLEGSTNPLGICSKMDKVSFYPYFVYKDLFGFLGILVGLFSFYVFFLPNYLGHPDNYIPANALVTPTHIVPEWYLLTFYAILRSIPSKLGGVLCMGAAILIFLLLPFVGQFKIKSPKFNKIHQFFFWIFINNAVLLLWLGAQLVEEPYVTISQISTTLYFSYFLIILPLLSYIENKALSTNSINVSTFIPRYVKFKRLTLGTLLETRKNFSTNHGEKGKSSGNSLKDFFSNLYASFIHSKKKSDERFKEVIDLDPILQLLDTIGSKALRLGFILFFCNSFIFREDIILTASVIQILSFNIGIICGLFYLLYFFSNKRFWYFNPDMGAMAFGASKVLAKNVPKVLAGAITMGVAIDQTWASITKFSPSAEYGKVLRKEQTFSEFKSGLSNSFSTHNPFYKK